MILVKVHKEIVFNDIKQIQLIMFMLKMVMADDDFLCVVGCYDSKHLFFL